VTGAANLGRRSQFRRRRVRLALQLLVSAGVIVLLVSQLDLTQTVDLLRSGEYAYVLAALAIFVSTTWLMAWRWQLLLASKGIREPLAWLTKLYFIGYAAANVLPTAVGGDAVRIIEHARRRPQARAEAGAAVIIERALGGAATLLLAAAAIPFVAGRFDAVWLVALGALLVAATVLFFVLLFSARARRRVEGRSIPNAHRSRLREAINSLYGALHDYRSRPGVLVVVIAITLAAQLARIVAMWMCGEAVGIAVSPFVYFILGPLLFMIQMIPFTLNGLGVREGFFVAFLTRFGVSTEPAFAAGLLYFAVTIAAALPGGLILLWRSLSPTAEEADRVAQGEPLSTRPPT
jgi:glycosyltransferase 2 family protein